VTINIVIVLKVIKGPNCFAKIPFNLNAILAYDVNRDTL